MTLNKIKIATNNVNNIAKNINENLYIGEGIDINQANKEKEAITDEKKVKK